MDKWLIMVTGGSRGFGRSVAEELVRAAAARCAVHVLLLARSEAGMRQTAAALDSIGKVVAGHPVAVQEEAVDLGDLSSLEERLEGIMRGIDCAAYSRAILVNNAGSLGDVCPVNGTSSLASVQRAVDLNVTAAQWVTSRFSRAFGAVVATARGSGGAQSREGGGVRAAGGVREPNLVINVSSLAALQPFETWGVYCAGKAARDMYHRVLAKEQGLAGKLRVLNYSPGAMDTDMQRELRGSDGMTPAMRNSFRGMAEQGVLVDPSESAKKCVRIALAGRFESGAHVDLWDDEP